MSGTPFSQKDNTVLQKGVTQFPVRIIVFVEEASILLI